ncbi:type IV toxin-antitoxin system AbiEi family antitoxin domain-containing protein [Solirubrobacter taibaiensis]|nr:type IV toxin-antitoxin system AbiEi family antitoxin domain-containing protein [Solirubrobacter taibaiensis]
MARQTPVRRESGGQPPSLDVEIAALAGVQHGVVTTTQLLATGLNHEAIRRRVRDGRLHRVHRGVYAVGHAALSREGRWRAAVFACGETAALSHLSAAECWNVSRWRTSPISVVTASKHAPAGIDVHRSKHLDPERDVLVWRGIPVTNVARMCVDLTDELDAYQLAYVIYRAEYWHIFNLAATRAAMKRATGRHNLHILEHALELNASGSAGTRSAKEDAFRRAQQSEPLVNVKVDGIEVDFHWPDDNRIVEVDGVHHNRRATKLDDARRDERLTARGWRVERVQNDQNTGTSSTATSPNHTNNGRPSFQ